MKKILSLILLTTLFVACSDDDDNEYINNSLIEGTWMQTENGYPVSLVWFTGGESGENYFNDPTPESKDVWGKYKLNKTHIIFDNKDKLPIAYKIKDDSLFLDRGDIKVTKYRKVIVD